MVAFGQFLEVLISGLLAGVLYSLVALGFVLIFKASGVFNFAQGIMVVFAALTLVGLYALLRKWGVRPGDLAAFMALGDDIMRIDTDELRVAPGGAITPQAAGERDDLAVDEHGHLLYVANACVWRYTEAGARHRDNVVCGPHR